MGEVYHDQYYGTLKSEVERVWAMGKHLVFDIDVRGAENIKNFTMIAVCQSLLGHLR